MIHDFNALIEEIKENIQNASKFEALTFVSSFLKEKVYHYDWVGFYDLEVDSQSLVLGPYTGKSTDHIRLLNQIIV